MFVFCLAFTLDAFTQKLNPLIVAGLLVLCFAGGIIQNFRCGPVLADLHWKEQSPQIERWVEARRQHRKAAAVSVLINPPGPGCGLSGGAMSETFTAVEWHRLNVDFFCADWSGISG